MAFTDSKLRSIKPDKEKRKILWEDGKTCLGVRVSIAGKKSFVYMYRFDDVPRMMTLGQFPRLTLAEARIKLAKARSQLDQGIDPAKQQIEKKMKDRSAFTVADLVEEFLEKWSKLRKKSWQEDERCLNKEIIPFIGKKKAGDVRRRDIILILDRIVGRGSPGMANRTLNVISKMFNFAVARDIINGSPCVGISMPGKKGQKDRVLDANEIKSFWVGLEEAGMSELIKLALKLQLITAQRRGEVIGMEWKEVNLSQGWWILPAKKSKNGLAHRIPLSQMAIQVLKEVKKLSKNSQWGFPSPRGGKSITGKAVTRAVKNSLDVFEIASFTPHDLRRTAASQMASAEIPRLTISKVLNHVEGGVTATYDRYSYDSEKQKAMETWSRKLESILTGEKGKIINLQRA